MQKLHGWLQPSAIFTYAKCPGVSRHRGVSQPGKKRGRAPTTHSGAAPGARRRSNSLRATGASRWTWSSPTKASTSGSRPGSWVAKRCGRQPATMIFWPARAGSAARAATASRIALTDSSLAGSMNEQVLTISTSASSGSGVRAMPAAARWPSITSESTRFLAQPSEIRPTVGGWWRADIGCGAVSGQDPVTSPPSALCPPPYALRPVPSALRPRTAAG